MQSGGPSCRWLLRGFGAGDLKSKRLLSHDRERFMHPHSGSARASCKLSTPPMRSVESEALKVCRPGEGCYARMADSARTVGRSGGLFSTLLQLCFYSPDTVFDVTERERVVILRTGRALPVSMFLGNKQGDCDPRFTVSCPCLLDYATIVSNPNTVQKCVSDRRKRT